jgi:ABC-type uncharacterized transport system ATPase subunit
MAIREVGQLTPKKGDLAGVDQISFSVQAGKISGFLGLNKAGKRKEMLEHLSGSSIWPKV